MFTMKLDIAMAGNFAEHLLEMGGMRVQWNGLNMVLPPDFTLGEFGSNASMVEIVPCTTPSLSSAPRVQYHFITSLVAGF